MNEFEKAALSALRWGLLAFIVFLLMALAMCSARAHDAIPTAAQPNGWTYPYSCCSGIDCREAKPAEITERPEGFVVGSTGEVVPYGDKRVRNSPDGRFHWCAHQSGVEAGQTICLFVPPRGF